MQLVSVAAFRVSPSELIENRNLVLSSRPHPQQGYRSALGILRLAKSYGNERLEAACQRANQIGGRSYKSVASILKHGLDQRAPAAAKLPDPQRNSRAF